MSATGKWRAMLLNPAANIGEWVKFKANGTRVFDDEILKSLFSESLLKQIDVVKDIGAPKTKFSTEVEFRSVLKPYVDALMQIRSRIGEAAFRHVMAGLIHLTAYQEQALYDYIRSTNGLQLGTAMTDFIQAREELAQELLQTSFDSLLEGAGRVKNAIPTNQALVEKHKLAELEMLSQPNNSVKSQRRVRTLSVAESGFRSSLAKCCATNSYFEKALEPRYLYFTIEDDPEFWKGHVTVVLGTADGPSGKEKIAFVDKVQSIANDDLPGMFESIRRSLIEIGYTLAVPVKLGDHNGISNS